MKFLELQLWQNNLKFSFEQKQKQKMSSLLLSINNLAAMIKFFNYD